MDGVPVFDEDVDRYQCPACGARFVNIVTGLRHTERATGNVPLRKVA